MSNAIYYPYIRVPENSWFVRVLLYSDSVGAIVPYDYIEDPEKLGEYMVGLVHEGLVDQVVPGMHLWKVPNFNDAFITYVDAKYGKNGQPAEWASVHSEKLGTSPVHMEKLDGLAEMLCDRGLAKRSIKDQYSPWLSVEARIANDFMAYLASVLGQITDNCNYSPITNKYSNLGPFIGQDETKTDDRLLLREVLLQDILPSPTGPIEPARLSEFKAKYSAELGRFRRCVESEIGKLAANPDDNRRSVRVTEVKGELRESLEETVARMNEQRKWPRIEFGTLCAVAGSGLGAWKTVMDNDLKFGLAMAALGMAPAIHNAFRGSDLQLEERPFAYAALAHREFG